MSTRTKSSSFRRAKTLILSTAGKWIMSSSTKQRSPSTNEPTACNSMDEITQAINNGISSSTNQQQQEEQGELVVVRHFSHPQHPLVQVSLPDHLFTCIGCKEIGAGKRFKCQKCDDFHLHDCCALAAATIQNHPLHNPHQHQLVFYPRPPPPSGGGGLLLRRLRSRCDVCWESIRGYAYRCSKCNFKMHPCCAKFSEEMVFPAHHQLHKLKLLSSSSSSSAASGDSSSSSPVAVACGECKRKKRLGGMVYQCTECGKGKQKQQPQQEYYHLHAGCAKHMVNGLHECSIKYSPPPQQPTMIGAAARIASHVILGFIGGLIEGLGEGVGEVLIDTAGRSSTATICTTTTNNNNQQPSASSHHRKHNSSREKL